MKFFRAVICAAILCAFAPHVGAQGNLLPLPADKPIHGLRFPALSPDGKRLCFSYQGDLWTAPTSGGTAVRLTIHEALSAYPRWSPDGNWIAFSSDRNGPAFGIYIIPAEGGEARQITYHSATSIVNDWSPDGSKILFYSSRSGHGFGEYAIDVKTGVVKTLVDLKTSLRYASYAPDGSAIAFTHMFSPIPYWRPRYHGSGNADIYTLSLKTGKITRVTDYDGMDMWPMYSADGKTLFYVTDRLTPGTPNVVATGPNGGRTTLVTHHNGDAVRWPCIARNGSLIAYEYGGDIRTVRPDGGTPTKVVVYARSDDKQNNIVHLNMNNGATEAEVSPDGKTLALVVRGDLWTIPTDKGGDATRLTNSPANDHDIAWSPDSSRLAFISDRKGTFNVYTIDVKTKDLKAITSGLNDETMPHWSPDGHHIGFLRTGKQAGLYVADATGTGTPVRAADANGANEFGIGITGYAWSPDSKWLSFSRRDSLGTHDVWIASAVGGKAVNVTRWPGNNDEPDWSSDGKYLLFLSDRDSNDGHQDLYSVSLQPQKDDSDDKPAESKKPADDKKPVEVNVDYDDIENRAKRLTSQGAASWQVTPDGKSAIFINGGDYWSVPVNGGSTQKLTNGGEGTGQPRFVNDGSKFYALSAGGTVKSIPRGGGQASAIAYNVRMDLDRRAELAQAFNEFWRAINVGFYDQNMHGVDWSAMRARYEPLLSSVGTKEEFSLFVLSEMVGELNASHSEVTPAPGTPGPQTAELGMSFDESYVGPGLKVLGFMTKGPDDNLGPKVKPGEYVLQIDGQDVTWNEAMYNTLADKAGKTIEMLVNGSPNKTGARTVKIKPITAPELAELDYQRRVKEARAQVDKLSGGRLAYIHIQGMNAPSLKRYERELWGIAREKDGLVLDVRDNGGGLSSIPDELLTPLTRTVYGFDQPRDAPRSTQPVQYWGKPIVLLINENSASGAEIFPSGFHMLKLGKIIGMPTPGYLIGTYEGRLQDGTGYRIPMWAYYTPDGKDIENNGVRPDIPVENTPDDIRAHHDRQLEVAIDTLLKELPRK